MQGKEIKELIKRKRLYQWEVAQELGINEFTLSRWLRNPLDEKKEKAILSAIARLSSEG